MSITLSFLIGLFGFAGCSFFFLRRIKRSQHSGELTVKWIITAAAVALWIAMGIKAGKAPEMAAIVVGVGAGSGIIVAILWAPHIADLISSPLAALYDGGDVQPELRPLYSIAESFRKRGQYQKAAIELRRQLAAFPNDFEGWMKLAELQAQDLKNLPAALETIEQILAIPELPPRNIAYALSRVADWQLDQNSDRGAALEAFERISALLPNSAESQLAAQRIAHLASAEHLADMHDPRVIALTHHEEKVGLRGETIQAPAAETPAALAQQYVNHLRDHPLDNDAREKLALVYANDFNRLDLAAGELETLIATPNQQPKNIVHWLNQIADLQIRLNADAEAARQTLQRILDLYPTGAAASNATVRLSQLRLELNQSKTQRTLKLGQYEQNIGLRKMDSSGHVET